MTIKTPAEVAAEATYRDMCVAARGLWAGVDTLEEAERVNQEYLAGQVHLIHDVGHPYGDDDPTHVRDMIARDIFKKETDA